MKKISKIRILKLWLLVHTSVNIRC